MTIVFSFFGLPKYLGAGELQRTRLTLLQQPLVKGFTPPRNLPVTCSLVVRPLATSTTWNPVRPATGMKNKPATHITAIVTAVRTPGELLHVVEDVEEAEAKHARDVGRQGEEEEEEVTVVPAADAVVHPGAVVVELLHAVVADAAVGTAGRPVEAAGGAPFHAHLDALDLHGFVKGRPEVVFFVFILFSSREDPWVHEGGHAEIGQHKEKHHRIVDGHCRRHGQAQPWTGKGKEEGCGSH